MNHSFFIKLNEAFAKWDIDYIADQLADEITWRVKGEQEIIGKSAIVDAFNKMKSSTSQEMILEHCIVDGKKASLAGTFVMTDKNAKIGRYAFCDIYVLNDKGKIIEMSKYVVGVGE